MLVNLLFFEAGIGAGTMLGVIALCVIVLAILRLRWWFAPLLIVILQGAFGLYHYYVGTFLEQISRWTEVGAWVISGMPENDLFSQSIYLTYMAYAMAFLVTVAVFFMMRRLYSIWVLIATFLMVIIFGGGLYNSHIQVILYMTAITIVLPRTYLHLNKRSEKVQSVRSHAQLVAIPIATLAVLLSVVLNPFSGSYFRWRPLANAVTDIGHLINPAPVDAIRTFDIYAVGFGGSSERLGGPVILGDGYMLTVVSNAPVLLTGSVMGYYTGYRWLPGSDNVPRRFNSFLWRDQREDIFGLDLPASSGATRDAFYEITKDVRMTITYATEFYTTVFSSSGMRDISFSSPALNGDVLFNDRSELFMSSPVPVGEAVTIHARMLDRTAPLFLDTILYIESLVSEDTHYTTIVERYTILPNDLPDIVRETAHNIVGDETSPFIKATAIATWLGENFRYTLNPVMPPDDVDFVAHFLETGEGNCTYYATAMAVMARAVGLPSRYVTGFALIRDPTYDYIFYATGRTAHAWAEVYFYGMGWIPFDPLDWNPDAPPHQAYAFLDRSQVYQPGLEAELASILLMYAEFDPYRFEGTDLQQQGVHSRVVTAAIMLTMALAVVLLILMYYFHKKRKYALQHVLRRLPDLSASFSYYYIDIMKQLRLLGMGIQSGETLEKYEKRIESQIGEHGVKNSIFGMVAQAQMRMHFANIHPSMADVEIAEKFHKRLKDGLQKQADIKNSAQTVKKISWTH